jgi:hypothetical protein
MRIFRSIPHLVQISFILSLFVCLQLTAVSTASAQTLDTKVTYKLNNQSLDKGLRLLGKLSGFNISYTVQAVAGYNKIEVQSGKRTVREVLDILLANTNLTYTVRGKIIMIAPKRKDVEIKQVQQKNDNTKTAYSLRVTVYDNNDKETIIGATCQIQALGAVAVSDVQGVARLVKIPRGEYSVDVSCVGYETKTVRVNVSSDLNLTVRMLETSLMLQEVTVVGKSSAAGEATATRIGRQAIDHLQATNLADLMQLIPGQLIQNTDMTSMQQIQLRSANSTIDANNSFGTQIIVDGIPISNNATMEQKVGNNTAGSGLDLRSIGADNIESVEVIRGIPSAKYGDLTSGAVIVNLKAGRTPYEFRTKVNPTAINSSLGKGWSLGKGKGFLNADVDYAQSWGDPRTKTQSFDRISGNLIYSNTFFHKWSTKTKLSFNSLIDWSGNDPDQEDDGTKLDQKNYHFQISHDGRIMLNKPLSRTLSYAISYSSDYSKMTNSAYVSRTGLIPILTARETGYYDVPFYTSSYFATGHNVSKPHNFYAKVANTLAFNIGKSDHHIDMGVEYRNESNKARGYYNEDDTKPLKPNSDGRPRPYYDVPSLNQLSAYLEDVMSWKWLGMKYKLQAGLRYTHLQPGKKEQVHSLSPRLNLAVGVNRALTIHGGYGMDSKTPGMMHLYPDKKYIDRLAANYTGATDPNERMLLYHTYVYNVQRSLGLKNATNTKFEVGFDLNLPEERRFTVVAYWEKTPNGFGNVSDFFTYTSNYYDTTHGLVPQVGAKPTINYNDPARVDTVFATKGNYGNTQWNYNRGIEFDFDLGRINAWNTSFYLSGAYMESKSRYKGLEYSTPSDMDNTVYTTVNTAPFKYVYNSSNITDINRRFSTQLRAVVNIPRIRMVLSTSCQVIWSTYTGTTNQAQDPIGYITANNNGGVDYHEITSAMLNDKSYMIRGCSLALARLSGKDNPSTTMPALMLLSTRLTKDISDVAGFSFYVNNTLFHQPWQHSSTSSTLMQMNEGTFNFGMELYFKF